MKKVVAIMILIMSFFIVKVEAAETLSQEEIYKQRMALYQKTEAITNVPWYYIAAIDQFERSIRSVRKDLPKPDGIIGVYISPNQWVGWTNPKIDDTDPYSITFFQGIGLDGDGDGHADLNNDEDILYTIADYLAHYGMNDEQFRMALWDYYQRDQTVRSIMNNAKIYRTYNKIDLDDKAFPIPRGYNYTYRSTWGASRGWGGRRIHEGTDIFAGYGAPVRAVAYGVVELKGWNRFGGWRIGIRDLNNTYHYYAHLNGFAKDIEVGDVVEPGTVIGSVGSSGYGPPGTSGKFPPHLHFGMYKDNGINEWAFDPFPHLRQWERNGIK